MGNLVKGIAYFAFGGVKAKLTLTIFLGNVMSKALRMYKNYP